MQAPRENKRKMWKKKHSLVLLLALMSCHKNLPDWTGEKVDQSHINWSGSWPNATNNLRIIYHGWKVIDEGDGTYSWAFRAKFTYLKNKSDDSSMTALKLAGDAWSNDPYVLPINRVT
jgi:hypothetical protein